MTIRPGGIGDCILALPAMEWLRSDYTEVWTTSAVAPLIHFADRVRPIATTGLELLGLPDVAAPAKLLEELRGFDEIVSWYGANRPEFREALEAAGRRVEFHRALPEREAREHCADFFARQVGAPMPAMPRIRVEPREREPFVAIHPFSGGERKNWPLERFKEVERQLPCEVKWCAAPWQQLAGAERFENLYELGRWLARCSLYIGNDSGITHLAAAVGAPVVAIFGPTDAAVWGPRGRDVRIVPQEGAAVLEAALALLRLR